ncbi:acetyltransferase [Vibrio cholerae]|nr:acetyltransferase [Vibrio cholerae]
MVTVVVFEFGVMRCQPLRRALGFRSNYEAVSLSGCINGYAQKK